MKENKTLKVVEIFYTLQGEGARSGEASIFIRLAECNKRCDFCDTKFHIFTLRTIAEISEEIKKYPGNCIVWTGGEPALQLTDDVIQYFKALGYRQAIETNGTVPLPQGLDYIACSPKSALCDLMLPLSGVDEFRFVFPFLYEIDFSLLPAAKYIYLSPLFEGPEKMDLNHARLMDAISHCMANPQFRLSVQMHKFWGIQ